MYRGFWLDFTSFVLPQVRFAVAGFALDIAIVRWFELHDELKLRWHTTMKVEQSELPCQRQNEKEWKLKSTTEFLWRPNEPSRWVSARPIKTVELKSGTNENTEQLWGDKWSRIDSLLSNYFRNLSVNRWWLDTSQSCRLQPEKVFFSSIFVHMMFFHQAPRTVMFRRVEEKRKISLLPETSSLTSSSRFGGACICQHDGCCCVFSFGLLLLLPLYTQNIFIECLESSDEMRWENGPCVASSSADEMSSWMSNKF